MVRFILILLAALSLTAQSDAASVPNRISYQGRLTNSSGTPLDGNFTLTFNIYDLPSGGTLLFSEGQAITVTEGLFTAQIGAVNPLSPTLFADSVRWLGINVNGQGEISPRTRFLTVPYAMRVKTIDGATGGTISGDVTVTGELNLPELGRYFTISPASYDYSSAPPGMQLLGGWQQTVQGSSGIIEVPLALPDSAWIDSVLVYALDSSVSRDLHVYMKYYYPLQTLFSGLGINASSSGAPGYVTLNAATSPFLTNNAILAYSVYISWIAPQDPEPASAIRVGAIKVWYRK